MYERRSFAKRLLIALAALGGIMMASVFRARIAVESLFKGIASQKSSGLCAVGWDLKRTLRFAVILYPALDQFHGSPTKIRPREARPQFLHSTPPVFFGTEPCRYAKSKQAFLMNSSSRPANKECRVRSS